MRPRTAAPVVRSVPFGVPEVTVAASERRGRTLPPVMSECVVVGGAESRAALCDDFGCRLLPCQVTSNLYTPPPPSPSSLGKHELVKLLLSVCCWSDALEQTASGSNRITFPAGMYLSAVVSSFFVVRPVFVSPAEAA